MSLDRESDPMLIALLLGELRPDAPEVLRRIENEPEFGTALAELQDVLGALERAASRELADRSTAREADRSEDLQGSREFLAEIDRRVAGQVEQHLAERRAVAGGDLSQGTHPVESGFGPMALAAAAIVVLGLGATLWLAMGGHRVQESRSVASSPGPSASSAGAGESASPRLLGELQNGELAPVGTVERYSVFRWPNALPENGWFQLRVFPDGAATWSRPAFESEPLEISEFTADPEAAAQWPAAIRWEVRVYDASGQLVDSASSLASRSSD